MIKVLKKGVRRILGDLIGFILYYVYGKKLLMSNLCDTKVLSIYFHNPSIKVFETIVKWLRENDFDIITLRQFQQSFEHKKCVNVKSALISFDDAWLGNLQLLEVINKYNVNTTLFVAPRAVIDGQLWMNIVRSKFNELGKEMIFDLRLEDIKEISNTKAVELYRAAKRLGGFKREIMTKAQLLDFSKFVSIGSHTNTHPILINCNDDNIINEFVESEFILNEWGLSSNKTLAYPNGSYNDNILKLISKTKYKYAFTTKPEIVDFHFHNNRFEIPRICIPNDLGKYENLARITGIWFLIFRK